MSRSTIWYRCATCGEVLKSWAAAERHGDSHHGARLDLVFPDDPSRTDG
jgi:hypothetical protein